MCLIRVFIRVLQGLISVSALALPPVHAVETGAGIVGIESGDDRHQPGVFGSINFSGYDARLYYCSQKFGPVFQSAALASFVRDISLPFTPWVVARTGFGVLEEFTRISFAAEQQGFDRSERRYNLGLALGLRVSGYVSSSVFIEGGWDSYLFPAGITGGLFLATGRKQMIYLGSGVRW